MRGGTTFAATVRANAARHGYDLSHIDDVELGARIASVPDDAADDVHETCLFLVYGYVPPVSNRGPRRGRYSDREAA